MATQFRKRLGRAASPNNASAGTQPIDNVDLPVVETEGALTHLRSQPPAVKRALAVLVMVVLIGGLWIGFQLNKPRVAQKPPTPPSIAINEARVTGERAISVVAAVSNAADGTVVSAQLLADGQPIDWIGPESAEGKVKQGKVSLRLLRSKDWNEQLDAALPYEIRLTAPGATPVNAALEIPAMVATAWFKAGAVAQSVAPTSAPTELPTALPTTLPTPAPTSPPAPAGPPSVITLANATLLFSPTLGSKILTTLPPDTTFEPAYRSANGQFLLIVNEEFVGWLPVQATVVEPDALRAIPLVTPPTGAAGQGPYLGAVFNGGNIRYRPSLKSGTVLGQMIAGQTVSLREKLADGSWYHVVAPAAEGWVARDLLTLDPKTIASVPIAK